MYISETKAAQSSAPSTPVFPVMNGNTLVIGAPITANSRDNVSNTVAIPVLNRAIDTSNELRLRVLKQKTISMECGGSAPRGQVAMEFNIPYKKKIQYARDFVTATPLARDICVTVTPVSTDIVPPEALTAAANRPSATDAAMRAGYCHITSELFFKDP